MNSSSIRGQGAIVPCGAWGDTPLKPSHRPCQSRSLAWSREVRKVGGVWLVGGSDPLDLLPGEGPLEAHRRGIGEFFLRLAVVVNSP